MPEVGFVLANDISEPAVTAIGSNARRNGERAAAVIEPHHGDAALVCYLNRVPASRRFDVVDLDPYGTAAPFLDGAVQATSEGGMLAVTCTDMGVLCGNHGEACYAKYGAYPLRGKHCHEMALRILLGSIDAHAARYKRYIVPLLAVSVDFYVRVFVRVFSSPSTVKRAASKKAWLFQCQGCESFHLQRCGKVSVAGGRGARATPAAAHAAGGAAGGGAGSAGASGGGGLKYAPGSAPALDQKCEHCARYMHIGGPLWAEPIHDKFAVRRALAYLAAGAPREGSQAAAGGPPAREPQPQPLAPPPPQPPAQHAAAGGASGSAPPAQQALATSASAAAAAVAAAAASAAARGAEEVAAAAAAAGSVIPSHAALEHLPAVPPAAVPWGAHRKLVGLLTTVSEELSDVPLYLDLSGMSGTLRCRQPPLNRFLNALLDRGHRVSRTHASATGIKTDAPWSDVWDVLRCWVAANPVKPGASELAPGTAILAKAPSFQADLRASEAAGRTIGRGDGVRRYPINPAENWGPGTRAMAHLPVKRVASGGAVAPDGAAVGAAGATNADAADDEANAIDLRSAKRARNQNKNVNKRMAAAAANAAAEEGGQNGSAGGGAAGPRDGGARAAATRARGAAAAGDGGSTAEHAQADGPLAAAGDGGTAGGGGGAQHATAGSGAEAAGGGATVSQSGPHN